MSYNKDEKNTPPLSSPEAPPAPDYTLPHTPEEKSTGPKILIAILITFAALLIGWKLYPLASDDSWQSVIYLADIEHQAAEADDLSIGVVPYDTSDCKSWDEISEEDLYQHVCVTGEVFKGWFDAEIDLYLILFSSGYDDFVLLGEDHTLEGITGHCVVATGLIEEDSQSQYMIVGRDNVYLCDESQTPKPTVTPNIAEAHPLDPAAFDTSDCIPWDEVDGGDVGDMVCVTGVVEDFIYDREWDSEYITFDGGYENFYMYVPRGFFANLWNKCLVATGEIVKLSDGSLSMIVYTDAMFACVEE